MDELEKVSELKKAIAKIETIPEAQVVEDKAKALAMYAKNQRLGNAAVNRCMDIAVRAGRKAGEINKGMKKHPPGPDRFHKESDLPLSYEEIGLTDKQTFLWRLLWMIPNDEFETLFTKFLVEEPEQILTYTHFYSVGRRYLPKVATPSLPKDKYG